MTRATSSSPGVGAVTPLGVGARTLHERWAAGECGIEDGEAPAPTSTRPTSSSRKEARRTDRFTQLALAAADEALADAGWTDGAAVRARAASAACSAPGIGGLGTLETEHDVLRDRGRQSRSRRSRVPLMMATPAPARVAMRHDLRGPVYGAVSACAAGAHAIGAAPRIDPGRRRRRRRHRRLGGGADAARAGGVRGAGRDLAEPASRGPSTRAATAS